MSNGELDEIVPLNSRQFAIAARRLADSLAYGTDKSPFLGSGIEYVQSRQYQPGDPIRSMDWRVTARTGKPHVREFETPRRLPCYLLIDTSASMLVTSQRRTKYETALLVAAGLGLACLDRVSPVGVLGVGGRDFHVQPSLNRDTILQWLLALRKYRTDEPTTLSQRIAQMAPTLLNRTLIFVLSDLHDPAAAAAIRELNQRHECLVIQLRDPLEDGLVGGGILRAVEAETGRQLVARSHDVHTDQPQLERFLKRAGVDHLVLPTDQSWSALLRAFLMSRNAFNRGAR
jgi:uncharacterized protein (DUF58 family)